MENLEIIIGTYESLILGYTVTHNVGKGPNLEMRFTDNTHRGALRCLAVSQAGILASSSTDDSVRLHNLKKGKEIGSLFEHTGTVNCILFYQNTNMITASEDNTICIWKVKNWELLRTLKGHKSHVLSFAIHECGLLGLSAGKDKKLFTWDLTVGKLAFRRGLQEAAQNVFFTTGGDLYVVVYSKTVTVSSVKTENPIQVIKTDWRINTACVLTEKHLAIGGDNQQILIVDLRSGEMRLTLDMAKPEENNFRGRVKGLAVTTVGEDMLLTAVTSEGRIKIFSLTLSEEQVKSEELLCDETKVRVTCLALYNSAIVPAKRVEKDSAKKVPKLQSKKKKKEDQVKKVKKAKVKSSGKKELDTSQVEHSDDEEDDTEEEEDGMNQKHFEEKDEDDSEEEDQSNIDDSEEEDQVEDDDSEDEEVEEDKVVEKKKQMKRKNEDARNDRQGQNRSGSRSDMTCSMQKKRKTQHEYGTSEEDSEEDIKAKEVKKSRKKRSQDMKKNKGEMKSDQGSTSAGPRKYATLEKKRKKKRKTKMKAQ